MSNKCRFSVSRYLGMLFFAICGGTQAATPHAIQNPAAMMDNNSWSWTREGWLGDAGRFVVRDTMNVYGPNAQRTYSANWTGNRPPPPPYGQQYGRYPQASSQAPFIEVQISETAPYVQQTIIYTFRIVSSGNLQSVNPMLPGHENITLKKIDGPIPKARYRNGRQEIVNEFHYALTVLKSGEITIPPLRVTGTRMAGRQTYNFGRGATYQGQSFDVSSDAPLMLQVKAADPSVRPWLPLHDLRIEGKIEGQQSLQPGKPLSLTINMTADGGAVDYIPSVASQLKAPGFRIYKESVKSQDTLSADGMRLIGHRKVVFTIVPVRVTTLDLAPVRLAWWNVDTHQRESAVFTLRGKSAASPSADQSNTSVRSVHEDGSPLQDNLASPSRREGFLPPFWMVVLVIFIASFLVWFWLWSRGRPVGDKLRHWVNPPYRSTVAVSRGRINRLAGFFSLSSRWQNIRHRIIMAMPTPFKIWFCARCLDEESSPTEWCQMFKFLACKHLKVTHQVTLSNIADEIIQVHPGVEPATMRQLMRNLRAAVYGGEALDFETWKQDFKRQIKPVWWRRKRRQSASSRGLPELNPHTR